MRRVGISMVLVAAIFVPAAPVWGCSQVAPPTLQELLEPDAPFGGLLGVYEQEHIAGTPNLLLRDVRTVSVVTRYWGQPPYLGREMHGDTTILGSDSCGNESGEVGDRGFGFVTERVPRDDGRHLARSAIGRGGLSPAEEMRLAETLGDPVELDVAWQTRAAASVQLWLWPMTIGIPLAGLIGWAVGRVSRRYRPLTVDR